jgi:hypothetical protein
MVIAERASARIAVGALALAAMAVSATFATSPPKPAPEMIPTDIEDDPERCKEADDDDRAPGYASIGAIAVVGTPNYEAAVREVQPLARQLSRCATETTRVTIYAHVASRHITQLAVLGDSEAAALCVRQLVNLVGLPIADDVDVMIPVDLVY